MAAIQASACEIARARRSTRISPHWTQTDLVDGTIKYRLRRVASALASRWRFQPAFAPPYRTSASVMNEIARSVARRCGS